MLGEIWEEIYPWERRIERHLYETGHSTRSQALRSSLAPHETPDA